VPDDDPASALADPINADPALFAPYLQHIEATPGMRWRVVQRAFMAHGIDSLQACLATARDFDNTALLARIRCPTFIACEENDPLAQSAPDAYAALTCPKTLVRFTAAEGAGDHCAIMARTLLLRRMFDWLDDTLGKP